MTSQLWRALYLSVLCAIFNLKDLTPNASEIFSECNGCVMAVVRVPFPRCPWSAFEFVSLEFYVTQSVSLVYLSFFAFRVMIRDLHYDGVLGYSQIIPWIL